jgi:hypothetical protein
LIWFSTQITIKLGAIHPSINYFLGSADQKELGIPFMATFFCVFLKIIEGGKIQIRPWPRAGAFSIPLAKGGVTDERSLAVRVSVLGWGLRVEQRGAVCQGRRAVSEAGA